MGSATSYRSLNLLLNVITGLQPDLVIVYEGVNDKGPFLSDERALFSRGRTGRRFSPPSIVLLVRSGTAHSQCLRDEGGEIVVSAGPSAQGVRLPRKELPRYCLHRQGYQIPLIFMTQPTMPEAEKQGRHQSFDPGSGPGAERNRYSTWAASMPR